MTTNLDIEALKAKAEKATSGPWFQSGPPWFTNGTAVLAGSPDPHVAPMIADTEQWDGWRSEQALDATFLVDPEDDAAFIAAANPSAILELIAQRAELLDAAIHARTCVPFPSACHDKLVAAISRATQSTGEAG